jgi:hypothetical protein
MAAELSFIVRIIGVQTSVKNHPVMSEVFHSIPQFIQAATGTVPLSEFNTAFLHISFHNP